MIVGFGTSLPEFIISAQAAMNDSAGLAHGNIIGSNIANILLVLALPALIFPIATDALRMRATAMFMLACTAAWIGVTMYFGLTQIVGMVFIAVLVAYAIIAWSIARARHDRGHQGRNRDHGDACLAHGHADHHRPRRPAARLAMLVDGGISLGEELDASPTIVGLTLLAFGSSLPELGAAIAAAVRKQSDVAMGNILGSNIFNILGAGGVVAILAPRDQLSPEFTAFSHWAMLAAAVLVTIVIFLHRRVGMLTGLHPAGGLRGLSLRPLGQLVARRPRRPHRPARARRRRRTDQSVASFGVM